MPKPSRDQKRKKKLEERNRRSRQVMSLAYEGQKYKTEELAPVWFHSETGIYQAFVMTDRKLLDQTVFAAVEKLILKLRAGTVSSDSEPGELHYQVGQEEELVLEMIQRNWAVYFGAADRPAKDDLIGVLRSILGTILLYKEPGPRSQRYLLYIEGFLSKKGGVFAAKLT